MERWEQRLTFHNLRIAESYLKREARILVNMRFPGILTDTEEFCAILERPSIICRLEKEMRGGHIQSGENLADGEVKTDARMRGSDDEEQSVFVGIIKLTESPQILVPAAIRLERADFIYGALAHSLYFSVKHGFKFFKVLGNREGSLCGRRAVASTAPEKSDVDKLLKNQSVLDDNIKLLPVSAAKIKALADGLHSIAIAASGSEFNAVIIDTAPNDKNYQNETWILNYSNKLLPTAKLVAADTLKPEEAFYFSGIADAPNKQPIITLTVQFQSTSRVELSTGLMVPFTPYHSYAKGSDASGNPIVQETTTYVVVPMAFVNYRVAEWPTRQQASAFFFTGGVGVNSSTKAVEFGAGATYSYRSFAVSMLFDIGRDTQLGGGLTSGGSLGKYSAPPTTTTWGVKPAAAVSIRIPLGGGSSTGK